MTGAVRRPSQSPRSQSPRARNTRARGEGADGFAHAQVAQIQRARILSAMFDVAAERGVSNVSVTDVVERSGVSRRTFYESFTDREDCFLAAFDDALSVVSRRVLPAYKVGGGWRERIRAGLLALLSFLDEEPVIGRLLIVESLNGGAQMLDRRNLLLARVAEVIDEGRGESANSKSLPQLTAEGLVGGVSAVIHARIVSAEQTQRARVGKARKGESFSTVGKGLAGLTSQLMSMIVLPYLGSTAARRELDRPVQSPSGIAVGVGDRREGRPIEDPFKSAGMRLTYRTVRVLLAIAEHPGASNRLIGETAGMSDQGQISKLLARLERVGLTFNTGLGPGHGAPNAWTLTPNGLQAVKQIRIITIKETR